MQQPLEGAPQRGDMHTRSTSISVFVGIPIGRAGWTAFQSAIQASSTLNQNFAAAYIAAGPSIYSSTCIYRLFFFRTKGATRALTSPRIQLQL